MDHRWQYQVSWEGVMHSNVFPNGICLRLRCTEEDLPSAHQAWSMQKHSVLSSHDALRGGTSSVPRCRQFSMCPPEVTVA